MGSELNIETIFNIGVLSFLLFYIVFQFLRSIRLVPTKSAYIIERLGDYSRTLEAGIHVLIPFFDRVAFIQDLKEETIDVDPQDCFTQDNVMITVDGVMYISVMDPVKASYGIVDYSNRIYDWRIAVVPQLGRFPLGLLLCRGAQKHSASAANHFLVERIPHATAAACRRDTTGRFRIFK